jgi:DNA-binding NarL/FixJ family response regulator
MNLTTAQRQTRRPDVPQAVTAIGTHRHGPRPVRSVAAAGERVVKLVLTDDAAAGRAGTVEVITVHIQDGAGPESGRLTVLGDASRRGELRELLSQVVAALHQETPDPTEPGTAARRPADRRVRLTGREREIALLVGRGLTNGEIAAKLYVTVKTVEYHLSHVYAKLGIDNRRQLRDQVQNGSQEFNSPAIDMRQWAA